MKKFKEFQKRFIRPAYVMLLAAVLVTMSAFSCADVVNILNDSVPIVEGVLPIVALADPALSPVVQAFVNAYGPGVTAADAYYAAFESALKADDTSAPTKKQQFLASLTALQSTLTQLLAAAQVKNPAHAALIQDLINAVIAEIVRVQNIVSPTVTVSAPRGQIASMHKELQTGHEAYKAKLKAILSRSTGDAALDAQMKTLRKKVK